MEKEAPFRVCEDCGDDKNVALIHWDGKEVPMCGDCRVMHGLVDNKIPDP